MDFTWDPICLPLNTWLENLQASGVDLVAYGREEMRLYVEGSVSWEFPAYESFPDSTIKEMTCVLSKLEYGSHPSDWHVGIRKERDLSVEALTTAPVKEPVLPGSWVE